MCVRSSGRDPDETGGQCEDCSEYDDLILAGETLLVSGYSVARKGRRGFIRNLKRRERKELLRDLHKGNVASLLSYSLFLPHLYHDCSPMPDSLNDMSSEGHPQNVERRSNRSSSCA
jgi:hypothetical protein